MTEVCRICARYCEDTNLSVNDGVTVNGVTSKLMFLINKCLPVCHKISEGDGLPNKVCPHCVILVQMISQFWDVVEVGQKTMLDLLKIQSDKENDGNEGLLCTVASVRGSIENPECLSPTTSNHSELNYCSNYEDSTEILETKDDLVEVLLAINDEGIKCSKKKEEVMTTAVSKEKKGDVHIGSQTTMDLRRNRRKFTCENCGKSFRNDGALKIHKVCHKSTLDLDVEQNTSESLECRVCDEVLQDLDEWEQHTKLHDCSKNNGYPCKCCGKSYLQLKNLFHHKCILVREKRKIICDECGKCVGDTYGLKLHKLSHTGEKPFACKECGKTFSLAGNLRRHTSSHTEERPYICDVCGRTYKSSDTLCMHKKTHTGDKRYRCTVCDKRFYKHNALRDHLLSHEGEKTHECKICNKFFLLKGTLTQHMQVHSEVKAFGCEVCGIAFRRKGAMLDHRKRHYDRGDCIAETDV